MLLRTARVGDERAVAEVHVRSWQVGYRGLLADDYLAGLLQEDRAARYTFDVDDPVTLVAVEDRIRGFVTISPAECLLMALYVDPDAWGGGVGRALLEEAQRRLAERCAEATLLVLKGNTRAIRFYEANGWRADGFERHEVVWGAPVDEVRYRRAL